MQLSIAEQELLESTLLPLLAYANERLGTVDDLPLDPQTKDGRLRLTLVIRALWHNPELVTAYARDNPDGLSPAQIELARDLVDTLYDEFDLIGVEDGEATLVHSTGVYRAVVPDPLASHISARIPARIRVALAPIFSRIVVLEPLTHMGASDRSEPDAIHPTADAELLARRVRVWRVQRKDPLSNDARQSYPEHPAGPGYHRGVLAGLTGSHRKAVSRAYRDNLARESRGHLLVLRGRSIETPGLPLSLEEGLRLLDSDWLESIAHHVCVALPDEQMSDDELITLICEQMPKDVAGRDSALMWCEDDQFELLRRLVGTGSLVLNQLSLSEIAHLYPMIPYVFILQEDDTFVAWMPPEIRGLLADADLDLMSRLRKRFSEAAHAAGALASMCGVIALDDTYALYRAVAEKPLTRRRFERALRELELDDARDSYALWNFGGTDYLISAELSDTSALARVVQSCYADHIVGEGQEQYSGDSSLLVDLDEVDEDMFQRHLEAELLRLERERLALVLMERDLPPHPLEPAMLSQRFTDYLLETEPFVRLRAYVDRHVPDNEDDYEFPTSFARAVIISSLYEHESYDETMDVVRLFGMQRCEGEDYPHALGKLVTDAFNALPCWHLNGWSLAENTMRVSRRACA